MLSLPGWFWNIPINLVIQYTTPLGVDPYLIAAMIHEESNAVACATRYEPNFKWVLPDKEIKHFARKNNISFNTEMNHQKTSWGYLQIMGTVARELGYHGPLVSLCEPELGLKYGIKKMHTLLKKYSNLELAIASYNAGSPRYEENGDFENQVYVDSIKENLKELGRL